MTANTVTAICAILIALGSLAVSYAQTHATREHNKKSVRPILEIRASKAFSGPEVGIKVTNHGLGPAVITTTFAWVDGNPLGQWDLDALKYVIEGMPKRPSARTLFRGQILAAGETSFLLFMKDYTEGEHHWFWNFVFARFDIEIHYESIYGNEDYVARRVER
jgi:hypothetical protein